MQTDKNSDLKSSTNYPRTASLSVKFTNIVLIRSRRSMGCLLVYWF